MALRMNKLAALALVVAVCLFAALAHAQIDDKPLKENWAPTEWGADDRVGAANRTTPEIVSERGPAGQAGQGGNARQTVCPRRSPVRPA